MKSTKEKAFIGRKKGKEERRMTIIYHSAKAIKEAHKLVNKKHCGKALRYVPSSDCEMEELMKSLG